VLNFDTLTDRQKEILTEYLYTGDSYKEIGDRLGLKMRTVRSYFVAIRKQLNAINQHDLLIRFWNPQKIEKTIKDQRFTESEKRVLSEVVSRGGSHEEIGKKLFISPFTVQCYINHIRDKTGAKNKAQLIVRYWKKQHEKSNQTI
jgi:DNA-binding CsgD family transcriptional regulator